MSWVSSIFKAIWAAIKKIIDIVVDFIREFWWVILIIVAIWFMPAIIAALPAGTPAFVTSGLSWIATNVTPLVTSTGTWIAEGAGSLVESAGAAWKTAELSTKASVLVGTVAALAPEEFAAAVEETVGFVADVAGSVVAGVASGLNLSTAIGLGLLGYAAYKLLTSDSSPRANTDASKGTA